MSSKGTETRVVEVMRSFAVGGYEVRPGARLLAWKSTTEWHVIFNGADIPVPPGTVGEIDSPEVKQAAESRTAREEEYQLAPSKQKTPST